MFHPRDPSRSIAEFKRLRSLKEKKENMESKTPCTRLLVGALLCLLLTTAVPYMMAQSAGTAALTGTITDPSGAAVPNVTVTITNNDTGQSRTTTTGTAGSD